MLIQCGGRVRAFVSWGSAGFACLEPWKSTETELVLYVSLNFVVQCSVISAYSLARINPSLRMRCIAAATLAM